MDRTFSSRRYLISTLVAAGAAATVPACSSPELPPGISDEVRIAEKAPPPITGGTLLVTSKGMAVASDPDRDLVWVVDLNTQTFKSVTLNANDEPGRVIEDDQGRVHVALRRGGDIVTINPSAAKVVDRSPACPAPRGMAYDAKADLVHVACAGGELVSLPAAGGAAVRTLRLDKDIRDIAISGDNLLVSRFRQAELLVIDSKGKVLNRQQPPAFTQSFGPGADFNTTPNFAPTGAWRMVPLSGGGVVISHQRSLTTPVIISRPDGYGGEDPTGCSGGIVHPSVTTFDANGNPTSSAPSPVLPGATLPVDMAVSADGNSIAVVAAGSDKVIRSSLSDLKADATTNGGCLSATDTITIGNPTAAAFWNNTLLVQTREPAALHFYSDSGENVLMLDPDIDQKFVDTGHRLFHHEASETSHIACASCHLEGHDDAHTWRFDALGLRRTQTLGGDIFASTPFHWDGDMKDLGMIMDVVFVNRMGGTKKGPRHVNAMQSWMGNIPRIPNSASLATPAQIDHGKALFASANCNSCHSGDLFTNNTNQDVGTGKAFQVPSLLGLANRAPYLHDGSALTIKDRFTVPGADKHGNTQNLSASDIDDLVAYLETL